MGTIELFRVGVVTAKSCVRISMRFELNVWLTLLPE